MAIKDLYNDPDSFKYNSKGNKYTKDIRGGGSSGQPFIKAPVPDTIDQLNNLTTEALSLDYPIRGGSYEELAARTDFARIDRFLLNYPQGKAFLDKQEGLLKSNPLMESRQQGGRPNTMQYSGGRNLMKQMAEGGTGFRYPQAGLNENELGYIENTYQYVVSHKPKDRNRLVALYNFKVNPTPTDTFEGGAIAQELGINDTIDSELFFYQNGPGSLYGLGSTTIRTATDARNRPLLTKNAPRFTGPYFRTDLNNIEVQGRPVRDIQYFSTLGVSRVYQLGDATGVDQENQIQNTYQQSSQDFIRANQVPTVDTTTQYDQLSYTMGYNALMAKSPIKPGDMSISDFRKDVLNSSNIVTRDYRARDVNITTRVGIGNPGARKDRVNTSIPFIPGQDKVNMYPITTLNSPVGIAGFSVIDGNRDLIKFAFETISNSNPDKSKAMFFRAYLTGYNDSHEAQWDSKRYAGRGENFYTYQGFDRTVSFNFKVAAQSKQEMKFIYSKVSYLLSTLYPEYGVGTGFMKGNFTKLTIGDLFVRTPGILNSLNLTVADEYAWEIAMNEPEGGSDKDMLETPQIMDIAVNFKPILRHLPRNDYRGQGLDSPILLTGNSIKSRNFLKGRETLGTVNSGITTNNTIQQIPTETPSADIPIINSPSQPINRQTSQPSNDLIEVNVGQLIRDAGLTTEQIQQALRNRG